MSTHGRFDQLTLKQFCARHGVTPKPYGRSATALHLFTDQFDANARWDLYHLRDYVVSSVVSGPAVVLVPRKG